MGKIDVKEAINSLHTIRHIVADRMKEKLEFDANPIIIEINEALIKETSRLMQLSGDGIQGNILGKDLAQQSVQAEADLLPCGHSRKYIVYGHKRVYCGVCDRSA